MKHWLFLLGGPLIWAMHFVIAYAIASISVVAWGQTTFMARALILVTGAIAALIIAALAAAALRMPHREPDEAFTRIVALAGAAIALIAVMWQCWPALAPI